MHVARLVTVTELSKAHPISRICINFARNGKRQPPQTRPVDILKLLDFDREATFITHLDSDAVVICRSLTEFMLMLCVLPLLPDAFSRPSAQLLKILFELLLLLLFLLCRPFLPFRV